MGRQRHKQANLATLQGKGSRASRVQAGSSAKSCCECMQALLAQTPNLPGKSSPACIKPSLHQAKLASSQPIKSTKPKDFKPKEASKLASRQ